MSDVFSAPYFSCLSRCQFKSEGLLSLHHFSKFGDVPLIFGGCDELGTEAESCGTTGQKENLADGIGCKHTK